MHNYQRYPVKVGDRVIQYIVSGGGGAFMHATHTIPRVDVGGVHEDDYRCYPLRGDSLSFYSQLYAKRLRMKWLYLTPDEAACIMAEQIRNTPVRPIDRPVKVTGADEVGGAAARRPGRGRSGCRWARCSTATCPSCPTGTPRRSSSSSCTCRSLPTGSPCAASPPPAACSRSWSRPLEDEVLIDLTDLS